MITDRSSLDTVELTYNDISLAVVSSTRLLGIIVLITAAIWLEKTESRLELFIAPEDTEW